MAEHARHRPPVSVVTGGALGIGGATSRRLAARGDVVLLVDVDESAAHRTAAEIVADGGRCHTLVGDVTEAAVVEELARRTEELGGADVLVNNVGDFRPVTRDFLHSRPEQWARLHDLNLGHVLHVTHALLPGMVERGRGVVVNNSTVEAFRGIPGHAVYSAYNAAVSAFTRSLAVEVGGRGVRVVAVAPDLAETEQTPAALMVGDKDPERVRTWVPLGRFGQPDEYARVIEFLASDGASYLTGLTVPIDGGTLAASGWFHRADGKGWTNLPREA